MNLGTIVTNFGAKIATNVSTRIDTNHVAKVTNFHHTQKHS